MIIRTGPPRWDWLFCRKGESWTESHLLSFAIAPQTPVLLKRRLWKIIDPHLPFCHWMAVHLHPSLPLRRSCSVSIILTCPHWRGECVDQGLFHTDTSFLLAPWVSLAEWFTSHFSMLIQQLKSSLASSATLSYSFPSSKAVFLPLLYPLGATH